MMNTTSQPGTVLLVLFSLILLGCNTNPTSTGGSQGETRLAVNKGAPQPISVSGSALHYVSEAIIHSQDPADDGMIQRSTDVVELAGDLSGYTSCTIRPRSLITRLARLPSRAPRSSPVPSRIHRLSCCTTTPSVSRSI